MSVYHHYPALNDSRSRGVADDTTHFNHWAMSQTHQVNALTVFVFNKMDNSMAHASNRII